MTRPLSEPSNEKEIGRSNFEIRREVFTPLAFTWKRPDIDADAAPFVNGYAQPSGAWAALEPFAYRLHSDGSLEFTGHVDAQGAVSDTVAFVLPDADDPDPSYRLVDMGHGDQFFDCVIIDDTGTLYTPALGFIDAVTGEVTFKWPAV